MNDISDTLRELAAMGVPVHLDVGDRMKSYEAKTQMRLTSGLHTLARIDGRAFSKFTRGLDKPDMRFNDCMIAATKAVVEQTHASLGYTQSDEITVVFGPQDQDATMMFDGRVQKLTSVLASMATLAFNRALLAHPTIAAYADRLPIFDCRVFQTPTEAEAANAILWRVRDATKNATSMVAQTQFGHSILQGRTSQERREMLAEAGVDFLSFPDLFRNGSFWKREVVERELTETEIARIPAQHRPQPGEKFFRTEVRRQPMPDHITFEDIMGVLDADRNRS